MSILNTKNNKEELSKTGAKKGFKYVCFIALVAGIVTTAIMVPKKLEEEQFSCDSQYGKMYPTYCEKLREIESDYKKSVEHILYHLNQDEAISDIEVNDEETVYRAPSGYILVTIVERSYTKEDGTKVIEYEEPLKSLADGEYVYSAPNGGTIKMMAQKEHIDAEGVKHTEYVEAEKITYHPHINYIFQTEEGKKMQCHLVYIDNLWAPVAPILAEEPKTLRK